MIRILLDWAVPVLIGAIIGYVTNDIAIKMLFRPLVEKRVFGLRLPLTPGIIPRNRHKLAVSLGKAVSNELLNAEVLSKRFREGDFREAVGRAVDAVFLRVLGTSLESLRFPSGSSAYGKVLQAVRGVLGALTRSEDFEVGLASLIGRAVDAVGNLKPADILGERDGRAAAARILEAVSSEATAGRARARAESALDAWLSGSTPVSGLIPFDAGEAAERAAEAAFPEALVIFLDFLRSEEMRSELVTNGREIVSSLLKRLNPFQRLVVAAARYEQAINENMEATVADLITHLEIMAAKEEVRKALARSAGKAVAAWASRAPEEILKKTPDARDRALAIFDKAVASLRDPAARERTALTISSLLGGFGEGRLIDIAEGALGLDREAIGKRVREAAMRGLGSEGIAEGITSFASSFIEARRSKSVGEIIPLEGGFLDEMKEGAADLAVRIIEEKIGDIVATIDVKRTVEEKIDSMDLLSVEKIILDVMKEQFAWINVFGAILGAVIGLVQALVEKIL